MRDNPIFRMLPMQAVVPMTRDDITYMLSSQQIPSDWRRAQNTADAAINKASKSALPNDPNAR